MGILFGIMALVGAFSGWAWLAVVGGILAIIVDAMGFMSGALHGCLPTIISWVLGALIGGAILGSMGLDATAAVLGGIALASMVEDAMGFVFMAFASR